MIRYLLQYVHAALQMGNPLPEGFLLLAETRNLGLLRPWLGVNALLDGRTCGRGHLCAKFIG